MPRESNTRTIAGKTSKRTATDAFGATAFGGGGVFGAPPLTIPSFLGRSMPPLTDALATSPIASASNLQQLEMSAAPPPNQPPKSQAPPPNRPPKRPPEQPEAPPSKTNKSRAFYSGEEEARLLELGDDKEMERRLGTKRWPAIADILNTEFGNHRGRSEVKQKWENLKVKQMQAPSKP